MNSNASKRPLAQALFGERRYTDTYVNTFLYIYIYIYSFISNDINAEKNTNAPYSNRIVLKAVDLSKYRMTRSWTSVHIRLVLTTCIHRVIQVGTASYGCASSLWVRMTT